VKAEPQTGLGTVSEPVTPCAVTVALQGTATYTRTRTCTGTGETTTGLATTGNPGSGVTVPITPVRDRAPAPSQRTGRSASAPWPP
jgi:hypothetical protein